MRLLNKRERDTEGLKERERDKERERERERRRDRLKQRNLSNVEVDMYKRE